MTALAPPPAPPAPRPAPPPAPASRWRAGAVDGPDLAATVALTVMTLVSAAGLSRLFADLDFLPAVLVAGLGAHAVAWLCRRYSLGGLATLGVAAVATLLLATWTCLPHTTFLGFPTAESWTAGRQALSDSWTTFQDVVAPVPTATGFTLACVVAVSVCSFLADWAAFRMRTAFEAVIPSFTIFAFTSVLGRGDRATAAAAQLAAVIAFLLVQRAATQAAGATWFAGRSRGAWTAVVGAGAVLGLATVALAATLGPNLPTAKDAALVKYRATGGTGPSSRATISPLVSIRGRVANQTGLEVMTVKSPVPAYWRLTALDHFDGDIWSAENSYKPTKNKLSGSADLPEAETTEVEQTFTISKLSSIWLPTAYQPLRISGASGVSYDPQSGSLISKKETSDGLTYTITSAVPKLSVTQVNAATPAILTPELQADLQLPRIPQKVQRLANEIVRGAATPFAQAIAIQNFFRDGSFTYTLEPQPVCKDDANGCHSESALEQFLFTTKAGYCEQYAGAFGVLARAIGLPTRVAVGFQAGTKEADGLFHVRDEQAHAWPEVYFQGLGWLAFEPTPGRGSGVTSSYTGVPEQVGSGDGEQAGPGPTTTTPTTVAGGTTPTTSAGNSLEGEDKPTQKGATAAASRHHGMPLLLGIPASLLAGIPLVFAGAIRGAPAMAAILANLIGWAGLYALALVVLGRRRRAKRLGAAGADPARLVEVAWTEADEALARVHLARHRHETPAEHATRVTTTRGAGGPNAPLLLAEDARGAVAVLAGHVSEAAYAGNAFPAERAAQALAEAKVVDQAVRRSLPPRRRLLTWINPRRLRSGPAKDRGDFRKR